MSGGATQGKPGDSPGTPFDTARDASGEHDPADRPAEQCGTAGGPADRQVPAGGPADRQVPAGGPGDRQVPAGGPAAGTRGRTALYVLRVAAVVTGLLALAQPVLAGGFLQGYFPLLEAHRVAAMILAAVVLVALVAAVLLWRPGGGPAAPAIRYAALLVLIAVQITLGFSRVLLLHIPLGVGIFVMAEKFAVDAFRTGLAARPAAGSGREMTDGGTGGRERPGGEVGA